MSLFQSLISQPANKYDVFLCIGDSICVGGPATGLLPQPVVGTAFEVVNGVNVLNPFGTSEEVGHSRNPRSTWVSFCINYHANTGRYPVICNYGSDGSTIATANNGNDWQTTGNNWSVAVTLANLALSLTGNIKLKGIFLVGGINDAAGILGTNAFTVTQLRTALFTVIDNLRSQFGTDVPILLQAQGLQNGTAQLARLSGVRNNNRLAAQTYANVHCAANMGIFFYAGLMHDGTHPNANGYIQLGRMYAEWWKQSGYTKWARSIICNHLGNVNATPVMSTVLMDKIQEFINNWQAAYLKFEFCYWSWRKFMTTWQAPNKFDWAMMCSSGISNGNYTVVGADYIEADGVDDFFDLAYNPALCSVNVTQNDIAIGIRLKQGDVGYPTLKYMMGLLEATVSNGIYIHQSSINNIGSNVQGTGTVSAGSIANIGVGHWILTRKNSDYKLFRDGVQVVAASNASRALINDLLPLFCRKNVGGARGGFIAAQAYGCYCVPMSAIEADIPGWTAAMNLMQD